MTDGVRLETGRGLWRCGQCGYCNVDTPSCDMCNAVAPPTPAHEPAAPSYRSEWRDLYEQTNPPAELLHADVFRDPAAPSKTTGRAAMRTVIGIIVANIAVQLLTLAVARSRHLPPSKAISLALVAGLMFYGAVAAWVGLRADFLGVQARWVIGSARRAALVGVAAGVAGAASLTVLVSQARGHTTVDPIASVLSGQSLGALALGAFVLVGLAPVVEELVFRGFLAEAFRARGKGSAVMASAVAFSLAHLRFAQFQYYVAMGVAFGLLYWKRGLVASICTHAGFNGGLLVIAVVVSHGSPTTIRVDDFSMRLPADWHQVNAVAALDWAALGPEGSQVSISHRALPAAVNPDRVAAAFRSGQLTLPDGATYDPASVESMTLSIGTGISVHAEVGGRAETAVIVLNGKSYVAFDFFANGSARAQREFTTMLQSTLPTAPAA